MRTRLLNYQAAVCALAMALALVCAPPLCPAGEFETLAGELAKISGQAGYNRLAINEFSAQEPAGLGQSRTAQQLLSAALFKIPGLGVMDAAVLEKIQGRSRRWAQVLVKGAVYGSADGDVLVLKATDLRSGRQLAALQISLRAEARGYPADLRDSPAEANDMACAKELERLKEANTGSVELKARYWAARIREPGFSYAGLAAAPGSELRDYATLQKFYTLFNAYYDQEGPVIITAAERAALEQLIEKEHQVKTKCPADR